jgi:hypothetical protein
VQLVLETPQLAAEVQGMHQMVGNVALSSFASEVPLQNAAIKNHFSMSPQSPVSARNTPWLNGILERAVDVSRGISTSSHAIAELE